MLGEGFVNRHEHPNAAGPLSLDQPVAQDLSEKLAHRALSSARQRPQAPALSAQARDRLYARMFPTHICLGANGNESDPIS